MRTVYELASAENSELCHPIQEGKFESINTMIDGSPRSQSWEPLEMTLITEDRGKRYDYSDAPWLGAHVPIFREKATQVLRPILSHYGEFLPLECSGAKLSMFNVTRVVDALDEEKSVVERLPNGKLMWVEKYAFNGSEIKDLVVFKIPNFRVSPVYCSQLLVDTWRAAGLIGLDFQPVWKKK